MLSALRREFEGNAVTIDTGDYFFGRGSFFPTFRGNGSRLHFVRGGYDAFGVGYRDLMAGSLYRDGADGIAFLSRYIAAMRETTSTLPPATCTNLNLSRATPLMRESVRPFTLMPLPNNRTLALLALTDPTFLFPIAPETASWLMPFERSLLAALAMLRRLPQGPPDIVLLSIPASSFRDGAKIAYFTRLMGSAIGVHALVVHPSPTLPRHVELRNWAGDEALIYKTSGASHIDVLTLRLRDRMLLGWSARAVHLNCSSPEDTEAGPLLDEQLATISARLGGAEGYVQQRLPGAQSGPCPTNVSLGAGGDVSSLSTASLLDGSTSRVCGCRVSECALGSLIADAMRWLTNSDVAFINGGAIRADLPAGLQTRSSLVAALPFQNDVLQLNAVPGSVLRSALINALSKLALPDAATDPLGQFLQVSSTLQFTWHFHGNRVVVSNVLIAPAAEVPPGVELPLASAFEPLDNERLYSVAVPAFLSSGGDGFTMLTSMRSTEFGVSVLDSLAAFLREFAGAPPGLPPAASGRILQAPTVMQIELGMFCSPGPVGRLECAHAYHMVEILNDKTDGLFDDLLPDATIIANSTLLRCVTGDAPAALRALQRSLPALVGVVGPFCSNNVAEIAHVDARVGAGDIGRAVFISPSSTAAELKDEVLYPNLARMAPSDVATGRAMRQLVAHFGWRRVAVLHDDSLWATSVQAQLFMDEVTGIAGASILNAPNTTFSLADFDRDVLSTSGAPHVWSNLHDWSPYLAWAGHSLACPEPFSSHAQPTAMWRRWQGC